MIEHFANLAQNGEFGDVAAALGGSAGGQFRGADVHDVEALIAALESGLRGVIDPETPAPGLPHATPLTNELSRARKIFVYQQSAGTSNTQCHRLFAAITKLGPNRLLVAGLANEWHPPGTVDILEDGLYRGYLSRFAPPHSGGEIDLPGWTELLQNTLLLIGQKLEEPAPAVPPVARFKWVEAVHPHWRGRLKLSLTDDSALMEEHQSRGKYRLDAGELTIFWDHFVPDHFIADAAGVFVHKSLQGGAAPAPSVPSEADTTLDHPARIYDGASMADPPEAEGVLAVLEEPRRIERRMPAFVADLSGRGLTLKSDPWQHIHGSYLVRRENVLLFGPNHVVSPAGAWSCEARSHKEQFLWYLHLDFYDRMYPGVKPVITDKTKRGLRTSHMRPGDVTMLDMPVFLATPLEPPIWGRWIATVAHKVEQFKQYGAGRKFLCFAALDWQQAFLQTLGLRVDEILLHDPGRSYICRDLMTVEYSVTNMSVSRLERAHYFEIVSRLRVNITPRPRLFVSRLSRSRENRNYRVLQNEEALAALLAERGFLPVEPEKMPFQAQVSLFAGAREVVCLGGSALFNTVFCAPGTRVVTIESSADYVSAHVELLASLEHDYGVIFGEQDLSDDTPHHKRWTLDLPRAAAALDGFFAGDQTEGY